MLEFQLKFYKMKIILFFLFSKMSLVNLLDSVKPISYPLNQAEVEPLDSKSKKKKKKKKKKENVEIIAFYLKFKTKFFFPSIF